MQKEKQELIEEAEKMLEITKAYGIDGYIQVLMQNGLYDEKIPKERYAEEYAAEINGNQLYLDWAKEVDIETVKELKRHGQLGVVFSFDLKTLEPEVCISVLEENDPTKTILIYPLVRTENGIILDKTFDMLERSFKK